MATILFRERPRLTKTEIKTIIKHIEVWFKEHKGPSVRVKLGEFGTFSFLRKRSIPNQLAEFIS